MPHFEAEIIFGKRIMVDDTSGTEWIEAALVG